MMIVVIVVCTIFRHRVQLADNGRAEGTGGTGCVR